ncbi:hypothetical protein EXS57_03320 [Candidatus Kaiserbacteria bacterium]|nr:hypothetical protein [Candidatus Kaiserbacteria bacterium]
MSTTVIDISGEKSVAQGAQLHPKIGLRVRPRVWEPQWTGLYFWMDWLYFLHVYFDPHAGKEGVIERTELGKYTGKELHVVRFDKLNEKPEYRGYYRDQLKFLIGDSE